MVDAMPSRGPESLPQAEIGALRNTAADLLHLSQRGDLSAAERARISETARRILSLSDRELVQNQLALTSEINQLADTLERDGINRADRGTRTQGDTMSGMRGEPQLDDSERESRLVEIFKRQEALQNSMRSATDDNARRTLASQSAELEKQEIKLRLEMKPIKVGEIVDHPRFVQKIREGYARMNGAGRMRFSPSSENNDAVNLVIHGFEKAGGKLVNPYSAKNPLAGLSPATMGFTSNPYHEYGLLLQQGIIKEAREAAMNALLASGRRETARRAAAAPAAPGAVPGAEPTTPGAAAGAAGEPVTPGAEPRTTGRTPESGGDRTRDASQAALSAAADLVRNQQETIRDLKAEAERLKKEYERVMREQGNTTPTAEQWQRIQRALQAFLDADNRRSAEQEKQDRFIVTLLIAVSEARLQGGGGTGGGYGNVSINIGDVASKNSVGGTGGISGPPGGPVGGGGYYAPQGVPMPPVQYTEWYNRQMAGGPPGPIGPGGAAPRGPEGGRAGPEAAPTIPAAAPAAQRGALDAQGRSLDVHSQNRRVGAVLDQWKQSKPFWRRALWGTLAIGAGAAATSLVLPWVAPAIAAYFSGALGAGGFSALGINFTLAGLATGASTGSIGGALGMAVRSAIHVRRARNILRARNLGENLVGVKEYYTKRMFQGLIGGAVFGGLLEGSGANAWMREKLTTGWKGMGDWISSWRGTGEAVEPGCPKVSAATQLVCCEKQLAPLIETNKGLTEAVNRLTAQLTGRATRMSSLEDKLTALTDALSKLPREQVTQIIIENPVINFFFGDIVFGDVTINTPAEVTPAPPPPVEPVRPVEPPKRPPEAPPARPQVSVETVPTLPEWFSDIPSYTENPSMGFERIMRAVLELSQSDASLRAFGSGNPSPITAYFREIMASNTEAANEFFSGGRTRLVDGIGSDAFERVATTLRGDKGDVLDYGVLLKEYSGSNQTILKRMIERATQRLGGDHIGVEALKTLEERLAALPEGTSLKIPIRP